MELLLIREVSPASSHTSWRYTTVVIRLLASLILCLLQGVKQGMAYVGAQSVPELHAANVSGELRFEAQTGSAIKEGGVHSMLKYGARCSASNQVCVSGSLTTQAIALVDLPVRLLRERKYHWHRQNVSPQYRLRGCVQSQ